MKRLLTILIIALTVTATAMADHVRSGVAPGKSSEYRDGVEAYRTYDYEKAIELLSTEIKKNPGNHDAYYHLCGAYVDAGRYSKALNAINKALYLLGDSDNAPQRALYLVTRAITYLSLKKYQEALDDANKAIELSNGKNYLHFKARAMIYASMGDYPRSDADCNKAIKLAPEKASLYVMLAQNSMDQKKYDEAVARYTTLIKKAPEEGMLYRMRSKPYFAAGKWSEGAHDLMVAIILEDGDAASEAMRLHGEAAKAMAAEFDECLKIDPNHGLILSYYGSMCAFDHQYDKAIKLYRRADTKAEKQNPTGLFNRCIAECLAWKGDYDEALVEIDKALEIDGGLPGYVVKKADMLQRVGRADEALALLDSLVSADTTDVSVRLARADARSMNRDYQGAADDYRAAVSMDSELKNDAHTMFKLTEALHRLGKADDVSEMIPYVIGLEKDADDKTSSAILLAMAGRRDEAVAMVESGAVNSGDAAVDLYNTGSVYGMLGDADRTVDYLRRAMASGVGNYYIFNTDTDFDPVRQSTVFIEFMNELKPNK